METRSQNVLVGTVAIVLTIALFGFVLWLARFSGAEKREFDIFFKQSVNGLAVGSPVAFSGVPVGQVAKIALMPESPQFVRVRITVPPDVPILQGVTASVEGVGFTGVSQIQLAGAIKGAQPITAPGPYGAPVIPTRPGAFGALLASAPELLDKVTVLVGRLNGLLNEENQKSLSAILAASGTLTKSLADRGPEIAATLVETRQTLAAATRAADGFAKVAATSNGLLQTQAKPLIADLRTTVARANSSLAKVDALTGSAQTTIPEANSLLRDLRDVTSSLGAVAAKLDEDPAGALIGGRKLPTYDPAKPAKEPRK